MLTRISHHQTVLILTTVIMATAIIFLPGLVIEKAGQDAWLSALLLIGYGFLVSIIYILLIKRMGDLDFVTFNKKLLG